MIRVILRGRGDPNGDSDEEEELLPNEGYSSNEENENEGNSMEVKKNDYDVSLPAQHLYLGELDEEGGTSVQEEETTPLLPLHYIPKHVLFPEETLPMQIYNPHAISMLRSAFTSRNPVAVCTDLRDGLHDIFDVPRRPQQEELASVGTTADIVACREDEDGGWFHGPRFTVKFRGRQRFRLLEVHKKLNGMMECRVKILPDEIMMPRPPLLMCCPLSVIHSYQGSCHVARLPEATLHSVQQAEMCRAHLNRPSMRMSACPVPGWAIQCYEFDYLREEVLKAQRLNRLTTESGSDQLPSDITSLSYWLSRRLPVDNKTKIEFLSINCPTRRLMLGLKLLKENTELYCSECGIIITQKQFIFSMSTDGPLAAYVNEGGYIHETLTVTECYNLKRSGRPSTQHSWFPGYQWTIMYCKSCRDHKGWCFEAVKKNLIPAKFYGLRRPGLVFSVKKSTPNETL